MANLLVIDDDRSLLELLADYLGRLGHEVEGAADGQRGLARWRAPSRTSCSWT